MTQHIKASAAKGIKMKVKDALKSDHSSEWRKAIKLEINSLINDFECLVPEEIHPDRDYDCMHANVDLKIKYIDETMIDKFKAKICGCGNKLVRHTTYMNETYSLMVSHLTHSTMLQLAIYDGMHICSIDTVGAFLYQEYPESPKPLYIVLPVAVTEACNPKTTYWVKKYIYGLPDSGRAYYFAYRDLIDSGCTMTASDPCLFVRLSENNQTRTFVWIHVDDNIAASTYEDELDHLKAWH
jgi:hypothetical protein